MTQRIQLNLRSHCGGSLPNFNGVRWYFYGTWLTEASIANDSFSPHHLRDCSHGWKLSSRARSS